MISHLLRISGTIVLIVLCMVYPFLPGKFDPLAVPISAMAQMLGSAGLLLVPIGALWLVHEVRRRVRKKRGLPHPERGYWCALASVAAASFVLIVVTLVGLMMAGISLGILTLVLWIYIVLRLMPGVKQLRNVRQENLNPAPIYLIFIPVAALVFHLALASPVTEFSRSAAIRNSAELINEIERHHARHGRYPASLLALHPDYYPSVVGIEKFHYAPNGAAYNLFFEQPRFLFDDIGTRELVVYNKRDEHIIASHAAWILEWSPERLAENQGWYKVHDASSSHWESFCFD
jgi:hypothetical protein